MIPRPLVMLLDDEEGFRREAVHLLGKDFEIQTFAAPEALFVALEARTPDLLLLDLALGLDEDGFTVHQRLRKEGHRFPVILLTIYAGTNTTSRALVEGIPYINKDERLDPGTFRREVGQAIEHSLLTDELGHYRNLLDAVPEAEDFPWNGCEAARALRELLRPYEEGLQPLLLTGELGCGKLTAARWIHARSRVASGPFIPVSARSRDADEFEREFYGVEGRGNGLPGALGAAARGTVFVQGLEDLPEDRLERLRLALASGGYRRVGSARTRRLSARVICSRRTGGGGDRDWSPPLAAFWKPWTVEVPPLREQAEDLEFHAARLARLEGRPGEHGLGALRPADLPELAACGWPENFHDLRRAVIHGAGALTSGSGERPELPAIAELARLPWRAVLSRVEDAYLREVHALLGRDIEAWVRHTGYARASIYRWLRMLEE